MGLRGQLVFSLLRNKHVICSSSRNLTITCQQRREEKHVVTKAAFVPQYVPASTEQISRLQSFVDKSKKLFVITGAGVSTESAIRGSTEHVGLRDHLEKLAQFPKEEMQRKRFWMRGYILWRSDSRKPNAAHFALSQWEQAGKLHWLVTQNTDGLHGKAGSHKVTELFGSPQNVICLECEKKFSRIEWQEQIKDLNPSWDEQTMQMRQAPHPDIVEVVRYVSKVTPEETNDFKIPKCEKCRPDTIHRPDLVFLNESVPKERVSYCHEKLDESDAVLVIGTTLEVKTAARLVEKAHEQKKPIVIVNIGATTREVLAELKIAASCVDVLPQIKMPTGKNQ